MSDDEIWKEWNAAQFSAFSILSFARAIEEQARREEREACARVCEDDCSPNSDRLANAIRARTTDSAASSASECGYCKRPRVGGGCGWDNCPYQLHDSAGDDRG